MRKQFLTLLLIANIFHFAVLAQTADAADSQTMLNGQVARTEIKQLDEEAKLPATSMTAQQYREMKYGVIGIMVAQSFTEHLPVIIDLLPECPAMLAGLQKGDELVKANGHLFEPGEGQLEFMRVISGEAGTDVDLTVNRGGKQIEYKLVRMNVEDIKDERVRQRYETILALMQRSRRGTTATH